MKLLRLFLFGLLLHLRPLFAHLLRAKRASSLFNGPDFRYTYNIYYNYCYNTPPRVMARIIICTRPRARNAPRADYTSHNPLGGVIIFDL